MSNNVNTGTMHQEVNVDSFLFSCFEYEKTQKARGVWPLTVKWPPLSRMSTHPEDLDKDIDVLVRELIEWYANEYAAVKDRKVDLETLHYFTAVAVDLNHDLSELHYNVKQEEIPSPSDSDAQDLWQAYNDSIDEHFPNCAKFFKAYANWSFKRPEQGPMDMSSMPPVGRNAPPAGSRISSTGYLIVPDGKRGSYGRGRDKNNNRNGNGGGGRGKFNRNNDRGRDRGDRGDRVDRKGGGKRFNKNGGNRQPISQAEKERREAEALKAVIEAINNLKSNGELQEVRLKPANSFLRRVQHNEVSNQGFYSHSIGEDRERAVVVTREDKEA